MIKVLYLDEISSHQIIKHLCQEVYMTSSFKKKVSKKYFIHKRNICTSSYWFSWAQVVFISISESKKMAILIRRVVSCEDFVLHFGEMLIRVSTLAQKYLFFMPHISLSPSGKFSDAVCVTLDLKGLSN